MTQPDFFMGVGEATEEEKKESNCSKFLAEPIPELEKLVTPL